MASRQQLGEELIRIFGEVISPDLAEKRVKFQPSTNTKLVYPCILYRLTGEHRQHADNKAYFTKMNYTITVIDRDPDSPLRDAVSKLPYCHMSPPFVSDNLYHYPFTIHW